jgi:CheY-like chemotaxis protein
LIQRWASRPNNSKPFEEFNMNATGTKASDLGWRAPGGWRASSTGTLLWTTPPDAEADLPFSSHESSSQAEEQPRLREGASPQSDSARALVVEDDSISRTAMRYLLAHHGWQASAAATLDHGRTLLLSIHPHVLVLDLMLPDGDGADLLRQIRDEQLPVRVAVLTGMGDPVVLDRVRQLQPEVLFRKPVNIHAFLEWLDGVKP